MRWLSAILMGTVAWAPMATAPTVAASQEVAAPMAGESVSERPDSVALVVYRDSPVDTAELMQQSRQPYNNLRNMGLVLVVEKRTIDVPRGEGVVRFKGLATGIVPHSATVEGLPAGVLEQNADYDLITPASLLEKAVGEAVTVVRTNAANGEMVEEQGVLRAGGRGTVVQIGDRIEALDCSGLTERIVFDTVPDGLGATPTLSIKTRAVEAGRHTITLAYLATGVQWSADYVARMSPDQDTLDLQGWITISNFGGTGFSDAPVVVVAGDLARQDDTRPVQLRTRHAQNMCWPQGRSHENLHNINRGYGGGVPPPAPPPPPPPPAPTAMMRAAAEDIVVTGSRVKAKMEELGDYKAYVLPHLTTVAANQMKQVLFLDQPGVRYRRVNSYWASTDNTEDVPTSTLLMVRNQEDEGLGLPVPQGKANVMVNNPSGVMWGGQVELNDTPVGLPIRLEVGDDPDVRVTARKTQDTTRGSGPRRRGIEAYETVVRNQSDAPAAVEILVPAHLAEAPGFRIDQQSLRSRIDPDRGVHVWTFDVPANGERTLTYRWSYDSPEG